MTGLPGAIDPHYLAELPDQRDHPEKIELWVAQYGAPGPTGYGDGLDDRFRYAGMIWWKDLDACGVVPESIRYAPLGAIRTAPPQAVRMTLSWEIVPLWLGYVLPQRRQHSLAIPLMAIVVQTPARGVRGYAARVECGDITPGLDCDGTLPVEAAYDQSRSTMQWWYRLPAEVAA